MDILILLLIALFLYLIVLVLISIYVLYRKITSFFYFLDTKYFDFGYLQIIDNTEVKIVIEKPIEKRSDFVESEVESYTNTKITLDNEYELFKWGAIETLNKIGAFSKTNNKELAQNYSSNGFLSKTTGENDFYKELLQDPRWIKIREERLSKDHYRCQECRNFIHDIKLLNDIADVENYIDHSDKLTNKIISIFNSKDEIIEELSHSKLSHIKNEDLLFYYNDELNVFLINKKLSLRDRAYNSISYLPKIEIISKDMDYFKDKNISYYSTWNSSKIYFENGKAKCDTVFIRYYFNISTGGKVYIKFHGGNAESPFYGKWSIQKDGLIVSFDGYNTFNHKGIRLEVHHKKYAESGNPWDSPLNDLITLCHDCHASEHKRLDLQIIAKNDFSLSWDYLFRYSAFFNHFFSIHYSFSNEEIESFAEYIVLGARSEYFEGDGYYPSSFHPAIPGLIFNPNICWSEDLWQLFFREESFIFQYYSDEFTIQNPQINDLPLAFKDFQSDIDYDGYCVLYKDGVLIDKVELQNSLNQDDHLFQIYNNIRDNELLLYEQISKTEFSLKNIKSIIEENRSIYFANQIFCDLLFDKIEQDISDFDITFFYKQLSSQSEV